MKRPPLSVAIVSCLFIAAGAIGLAFHAMDLKVQHPVQYDLLLILLIRLLAVVFGVYMLRGSNWARWGTILWLAFHVVISGFHSLRQLGVHALLLVVFAYFLFASPARDYFQNPKAAAT